MQQNQRWPGSGTQVAHPRAVKIHPAFFHALKGWRTCDGCLPQAAHLPNPHPDSFRSKDNSFLAGAFYLSETTPLSLHFGELRLPDFFLEV
jgi:hypothetical protein